MKKPIDLNTDTVKVVLKSGRNRAKPRGTSKKALPRRKTGKASNHSTL